MLMMKGIMECQKECLKDSNDAADSVDSDIF